MAGRRIAGVDGYLEVSVLALSAVEASVLGRRSIGCLERLRDGVRNRWMWMANGVAGMSCGAWNGGDVGAGGDVDGGRCGGDPTCAGLCDGGGDCCGVAGGMVVLVRRCCLVCLSWVLEAR